jgi:GNAT superfamily N-acetyltransferase
VPVAEEEGARRILLDADGAPVARFEHAERDGGVYADMFVREQGVPAERAAAAALADLRGLRIAGDEELGRVLIAAGGRLLRHGHVLSRDLRRDPAAGWSDPPGYRLTTIDRPAAEILDVQLAAYPLGHVDHRDEPRERSLSDLEAMLAGRYGPLLEGSGVAIAPDGTVAAALLLGTVPGEPPLGGPWVLELFRHPAHRGTGRPLLERALALATRAGLPTIGLAVSEGNSARGLYEALSFVFVNTFLVVEV